MKNKLIKAMIVVLLIQVTLFVIAIFGGNTIQNLSLEYINILESRVLLRKNYIEDEMLQRWSNIGDLENYIQNKAKELGVQDDPALVPQLLKDVADQSVVSLRKTGVTEVFVILEGEKGHQGIHLRDLDPLFNTSDNSDILMERGSIDIAKNIGASLDSEWSNKFNLSQEDKMSEYYYKPFLAVESHPNLSAKDLAYWSKPFKLSPDDIEIITYSIPLINEKGKAYGVIGVGLTADYLSEKLKYDELNDNKRGFYTLSVNDEKAKSDKKIVSSGPMYDVLIDPETAIYDKQDDRGIYKVRGSENVNGDIYASVQKLDLYNSNTPFEDERWSITGFVEGKCLFRPIEKIINSVIISLIISLFLGIIAVILTGSLFMKPINQLMKRVLESNPNNPFKLKKTNITEIDELGLAIETLNNEVIDSASKVSQIINMVNVSIGVFEYREDEEQAFCTNTVFDVLGIENDKSVNYVKTSYLKEVIERIKKKPEKDIANVYRYRKQNAKTCWVQLITQNHKDKVLGVIEDVTEAVISKRKIEYERDHDMLTHILNRRAFEVQVKRKMEQGNLEKAAFVMWDLDNLKYINDTYGHEYGDRYIQKTALVLSRFKMYNTIVARMSGDEFYTFIYGYKEKEDIRKIINEIKDSLYNSFLKVPDKEDLRIRISGGVAWYPDDSKKYDELIRYSDFAMYEIKSKDKGNVAEFNIDTYNRDSILLHGKKDLNDFIDKALVKFAFQPIVDARTGEVFGYESLMRPQIDSLKSPYNVLRLAQSQSKLYEIEKLTLFESMKAFEELKEYFNNGKIFINSIANHVLTQEDVDIFGERFSDNLKHIIFEITENEQSDNKSTKAKQLATKKWGVDLALDDFGSGYNSELTLLVLSPQYIKIDMNIIRGIDKDLNRQKLLKNMLSYTKDRNIKIIAEGVESKNEMMKLIEFGIDYMQGYYLGKPKMIPQPLDPKIELEIQSYHNLTK